MASYSSTNRASPHPVKPAHESSELEKDRTGFSTENEPHPSQLVDGGQVGKNIGVRELRHAIPSYCFEPSIVRSFFYLFRDLTYSAILLIAYRYLLALPAVQTSTTLYYITVNLYGFCQGIVWTGLWIIAHDAGHSGFSRSPTLNDTVGFILHSALLAPYFSWKSTHRRHHIYANHMEKDLNYVPLTRNEYAKKIGVALEQLEEVGQDAPLVLFLRILFQQLIGWNWYILSNITTPATSTINPNLSVWRYSHFDPWGGMFRQSEKTAVILSDIGCLSTLTALYALTRYFGSFEPVFWLYIVPWSWVNHWIVMITFLHHTHPELPKFPADSWTFVRGATATMDRNFGFIGSHFFHHITSDHVIHHLFSSIPHYYAPTATAAVRPLLGDDYHGGASFTYRDLKIAFADCQWVEENESKDRAYGLHGTAMPTTTAAAAAITTTAAESKVQDGEHEKKRRALWYRKGVSPLPEFHLRPAPARVSS